MTAIGISFFSNGGFLDHSSYVLFNREEAAFVTNYGVALSFSDLIKPLKVSIHVAMLPAGVVHENIPTFKVAMIV